LPRAFVNVGFDNKPRILERAGVFVERRSGQRYTGSAQLPARADETAAGLQYPSNFLQCRSFVGYEEQDVHAECAIEAVITPSCFRNIASLEPEKPGHSGRDREFLSHTGGERVSVYAFNVSTELFCEVASDATTAKAKVREFGFRTGIQPLRQKLDVVDSGLL